MKYFSGKAKNLTPEAIADLYWQAMLEVDRERWTRIMTLTRPYYFSWDSNQRN